MLKSSQWILKTLCVCVCRYLDNVVNNQTGALPIPHLHALLTSGDEPPPQIEIFDLIKSSYQVRVQDDMMMSQVCCWDL